MSVKWGVMSTAGIASKVAGAIKRAGNAELVAVASRSMDRADAWAKEHGVDRSYGNYEALLADPDIEAVYIPLPPSMHAEWAIKAAEAGKHVLSEKPLTVDVAEAVAVVDACESNGVQLMDGVMWVHHDWTEKARAILKAGELGDLRRVTASFTFYWGSEIPVDNIRAQKEMGGGALGDLGYYCIRAILWAFEEVPRAVYARARYANGVDIEVSGMLYFSQDRIASFDCGFTIDVRISLELAGTKGSLRVDPFVLPPSEEESTILVAKQDGVYEQRPVGPCVQEVNMIERFSGIVESGNLVSTWPNAALDTVRVCCALAESAETGNEVEI